MRLTQKIQIQKKYGFLTRESMCLTIKITSPKVFSFVNNGEACLSFSKYKFKKHIDFLTRMRHVRYHENHRFKKTYLLTNVRHVLQFKDQ